jgi:hypothetical protein
VVAQDTNTAAVSQYSNQTNWSAPFQPINPALKSRTVLAL